MDFIIYESEKCHKQNQNRYNVVNLYTKHYSDAIREPIIKSVIIVLILMSEKKLVTISIVVRIVVALLNFLHLIIF